MRDGKVGYGKPPIASRFKPGVSGNPSGKPKNPPSPLSKIIGDAFSEAIVYFEGGREKTAPAFKLFLRDVVGRARAGSLEAMETLNGLIRQAERESKGHTLSIIIEDWLPDEPIAPAKTDAAITGSEPDPFGREGPEASDPVAGSAADRAAAPVSDGDTMGVAADRAAQPDSGDVSTGDPETLRRALQAKAKAGGGE